MARGSRAYVDDQITPRTCLARGVFLEYGWLSASSLVKGDVVALIRTEIDLAWAGDTLFRIRQ
jgi:hypothetical protein